MDKETYEKQRAFAGDKQPSMLRRCVGHDYTERRMYMITMVTEGRQPLFGTVLGKCDAEPGDSDFPHIELTELGQHVSSHWHALHERYPQIEIIALQMMPDHFHGILFVKEKLEKPLGKVLLGFKQGCNKAFKDLMPEVASVAVLQQHTRLAPKAKTQDRKHGLLFVAGYNDKILFRQGQLETWLKYLRDNPRRLLMKRQRPDLFRVCFGLKIGNQTYSAIGNQFLLTHPIRLQVQCSRRLTEAEIAERVSKALSDAERGAVHVSPAISSGEKAVMRALLNAHHPLIFLEENGLTPYTKPGGEFFEACSRGELLILAPWEHHNERNLISRKQCLTLNELAMDICNISNINTYLT